MSRSGSQPLDHVVIASPCMASLAFIAQASPRHYTTGKLMGTYEVTRTKTDTADDSTLKRAVIAELQMEAPRGGNGNGENHPAPPRNRLAVIGTFFVRRRSSHRLTFNEEKLASSPAEPSTGEVVMVITEEETETGLITIHYTIFRRPPHSASTATTSSSSGVPLLPKEIPLRIINLVSTGGEYESIAALRLKGMNRSTAALSFQAEEEPVEADIAAATDALTQSMKRTVQTAQLHLLSVREETGLRWRHIMESHAMVKRLSGSIQTLRREAEELQRLARLRVVEAEIKARTTAHSQGKMTFDETVAPTSPSSSTLAGEPRATSMSELFPTELNSTQPTTAAATEPQPIAVPAPEETSSVEQAATSSAQNVESPNNDIAVHEGNSETVGQDGGTTKTVEETAPTKSSPSKAEALALPSPVLPTSEGGTEDAGSARCESGTAPPTDTCSTDAAPSSAPFNESSTDTSC